jgi:carboxypeptidase family protein
VRNRICYSTVRSRRDAIGPSILPKDFDGICHKAGGRSSPPSPLYQRQTPQRRPTLRSLETGAAILLRFPQKNTGTCFPNAPYFWVAATKLSLLSIFTLSAVATTFGQTTSAVGDVDQTSGLVTAVIVDQSGDPIQRATVSLIKPVGGKPEATLADQNGSFTIQADPGAFDIQFSAPGFATKCVHGELRSNQHLDLGRIELRIQISAAEVVVSVTDEQLAEEQVQSEERQRILGVIPNFFVTYDPNAVPLHAKQKYELAFKTLIDPETIGVDLVSSGVQQETGGLKGYGTGPNGYAKRLGAAYGTGSIDTLLGSAVFPSVFKQDPRYFYKGTGTIRRRAFYAIGMAVMCKGDNGHWQYNYSGVLGGLAAGGFSNLYYPRADRNSFGVMIENTAIGIGSSAISNLLQEFLIRRFTRTARQQNLQP